MSKITIHLGHDRILEYERWHMGVDVRIRIYQIKDGVRHNLDYFPLYGHTLRRAIQLLEGDYPYIKGPRTQYAIPKSDANRLRDDMIAVANDPVRLEQDNRAREEGYDVDETT